LAACATAPGKLRVRKLIAFAVVVLCFFRDSRKRTSFDPGPVRLAKFVSKSEEADKSCL
jgi:hypothetical protein